MNWFLLPYDTSSSSFLKIALFHPSGYCTYWLSNMLYKYHVIWGLENWQPWHLYFYFIFIFLKPQNSLLGLFDHTVVEMSSIGNTVRRPLLKNIYPFFLLAVLPLHRQRWQTREEERFTFIVDYLVDKIHWGLGMDVDADIEHLLFAVNKSVTYLNSAALTLCGRV